MFEGALPRRIVAVIAAASLVGVGASFRRGISARVTAFLLVGAAALLNQCG